MNKMNNTMGRTGGKGVSLAEIFCVFAKVGAFTIGGGYAMIPIIEKEVCGRGWISEEEFPDCVALAQSAPGLLAVNVSIFAGYKIAGTKGSVIATLGSITPPFLIILAIAMLFTDYQNNTVIMRIFKGIRPAVVALIAVPVLNMAKKSDNRTWLAYLLMAGSTLLVAFAGISPIYILICVIVCATLYALYTKPSDDIR